MPLVQGAGTGLFVALGIGLLIGLERERRKGEGDDRRAAGIRSFTVTALLGALAQASGSDGAVVVGLVGVALLVAAAYRRSHSRDPGLTTELALIATYLVGVQSVIAPVLGAGCGAALTLVLAARSRLHHFARRALSEAELRDGLMLAGLALVVLPLVPQAPVAWLGGLQPRSLATLVLLILVLQAAGHVALRVAGARAGLAASGFFGGFVSSTATIAALGSRVRLEPEARGALAGAAILSTAATWVQVLLMAAAVAPSAALVLAPAALAGGVIAGVLGSLRLATAMRGVAPAPRNGNEGAGESGPLRLREALAVAVLLSAVALGVAGARHVFGDAGLYAGAALAGLADAQSPVGTLSTLFAGGSLAARGLWIGVLLAVTSNGLTRIVTATMAGGGRFGVQVGAAIVAGTGAAWASALLVAG
jgi:uncharacterized membrane protein (DUF4010 family)